MKPVLLERGANGSWVVSVDGAVATWRDLSYAALSAIQFAAIVGGGVELGDEVPADALEQGERLRVILAHYRGESDGGR